MKKNIKKLIIIVGFAFFIFVISNIKSNAAELWWPIGSDDNDANTYYVDANGARLQNIEINAENDKKYKKMAVGFENETDIEYWWAKRSYKVNNETDPNEKPYAYNNENHYGIDIRSSKVISNNPIKIQSATNYHNLIAAGDGEIIGTSAERVTSAGINFIDRNQRRTKEGLNNGGGYGNYVLLKTKIINKTTNKEENVILMYAHMYQNSILVKKGEKVVKGQVLGKMGSSGDSGHPHLHFEIRKENAGLSAPNASKSNLVPANKTNTYDPAKYVSKENQRDGMTQLKKIYIESYNTSNVVFAVEFYGNVKVLEQPKFLININGKQQETEYRSAVQNKLIYSYTIKNSDSGTLSFNSVTGGNIVSENNSKVSLDNIQPSMIDINLELQEQNNPLIVDKYSKGDVTGDGIIDTLDAKKIQEYVVSLITFDENQLKAADANGDGQITSYDVLKVLQVIVGLEKLK